MRTRQIQAFNTATKSDNKIHDDEVARRFGFTGGLVPGVDVYGYLSWGPVSEWGIDWLERGTAETRFGSPTYDGQTVSVEWDEPRAVLRNPDGVEVAWLEATLADRAPRLDPAAHGVGELPEPEARPDASEASLPQGLVLGAVGRRFSYAQEGERYLADARETLDLYVRERVAHPAWLLRFANEVLARNVVLGPWIHVGSRIENLAVVRDGQMVQCRASVVANYERKGHRFVDLDVVVLADDQPVNRIAHTAIYLPRQVAAA
ncbi:MAG: hypothetical protein OEY23_19095 [Acidimicrobiia bacterium]|nr:hypothetical protein [Acidimicrobiia bacterium]